MVRIFINSVVRHERFFRCCAMELVSKWCIVMVSSRYVDEVKPTYILLFSEVQYPKSLLNAYLQSRVFIKLFFTANKCIRIIN